MRHNIHQTVVRSIEILPSFDIFSYGTNLWAIQLAFGGIDLTSLVFIDDPEGVEEELHEIRHKIRRVRRLG